MNKLVTSYQFNMFVKQMPVTPSPDFVGVLFTKFGSLGLYPGVGNEVGGNGQQVQFFRLATHDDRISIAFNTFALSIVINDVDSKPIAEIIEYVEQAYTKLLDAGVVLSSNRLSVVASVINEVDVTEARSRLHDFITSKVNPAESVEWESRVVSRKELHGVSESINVVNAVRNVKASLPAINAGRLFDAIIFDYDINTLQENNSYRFNLSNAMNIYQELIGFIGSNVFEQVWNEV